MAVRKAVVVLLALLTFPVCWAGVRYLQAQARIRGAWEDLERGLALVRLPPKTDLPDRLGKLSQTYALDAEFFAQLAMAARHGVAHDALQRCGGLPFFLRHPPFGVFGSPPPRPLGEMREELEAVRLLARRGGLSVALLRIAEERAFVARLLSMKGFGQVLASELESLRAELPRLDALREPLREAFEVERLLLMKEVLTGSPPPPGEIPLLPDRPGWQDLRSRTLLRARALQALDEHFDRLREAAGLSPEGRMRTSQEALVMIQASPSPLAPWVLGLHYEALHFEAEVELGMARFR